MRYWGPEDRCLQGCLHEQDGDTSTVTTATDYTDVSDDTNAPDIVLIDDVYQTYGGTLDMLYAQTASFSTEANKDKHHHWKPPKRSSLPVSDVHCMMADTTDNINRANYSIKKADSTPQHSDVIIEGITYSISMALTTYHVSTSCHSKKSGSLVNHGAHGGIAGDDCHVIETTMCYVNVEGIDNHVMEKYPIVTAGATV